jgi:hypothetical protein
MTYMIKLITYNLHFANKYDIHRSSKNDEESDKGHDLDLLMVLYYFLLFIFHMLQEMGVERKLYVLRAACLMQKHIHSIKRKSFVFALFTRNITHCNITH